jgi:hypothetical protein
MRKNAGGGGMRRHRWKGLVVNDPLSGNVAGRTYGFTPDEC